MVNELCIKKGSESRRKQNVTKRGSYSTGKRVRGESNEPLCLLPGEEEKTLLGSGALTPHVQADLRSDTLGKVYTYEKPGKGPFSSRCQ